MSKLEWLQLAKDTIGVDNERAVKYINEVMAVLMKEESDLANKINGEAV